MIIMKLVDANIILRYLLNDVKELAQQAYNIINNNTVFITNEVFAEIIYVLEKVYNVERIVIAKELNDLLSFENIRVNDVIKKALNYYEEKNLDIVDLILLAYSKVEGYEVYTFDKKLNRLINQ